MILGEKIANLRKQNGWSQEELAEMMNVSRQSVSKWEGSQSVPDLDRILQLARLFSVTTDYLLKDEAEITEFVAEDAGSGSSRVVSLQEANEYLALRKEAAPKIALGVFLCIISPICMLILGALSETYPKIISENVAGFFGIAILLILVAIAVSIFIYCGGKSQHFQYLEDESFETAYGVSGMVRERQKQFRGTYTKFNLIGAMLCVLAPIILLSSAFLAEENDIVVVLTLCIMLFVIAVAVVFFVRAGVIWESMQKLLQEGDYTINKKKYSKLNGTVAAVYWILATAIYLYLSMKTFNWGIAAYFWPVAGLVYAAIAILMNLFQKNE